MNVIIATGGTAGHVVPALAVADVLRARGISVTFIGGSRVEAQLVPAAGYRFHQLKVEGLSRSNPLLAARALLRAVGATVGALRILRSNSVDVVMGGGGYVAGPVGLAAAFLRIPLVLTEADRHLGVTNRLLARFAKRVCLAFELEGRTGSKYVVTGRPIPPVWHDRQAARAAFSVAEDERCLLIFGGSLGARSINDAAIEAFKESGYKVLHVTGEADNERLQAQILGDNYQLFPYLNPLSQALAAADLCIARSGGSIFEIAAHGLPAILVPYPHASADHQTANARWLADIGAATIIPDDELTAKRLRDTVTELFSAEGKMLAEMTERLQVKAYPNASTTVAEIIQEVASG